ncbi:NUDIX hydrolase [Ferrimonas kyonanensis]|uniref:NUDIX hydrolase n=1 Tax=Ferrimonas kyonanensis TaxID=364763 RepID=UPI00040933F3|nr:NUDIX domain-containing protein [Ferrimonas kyonanensis]
MQLLQRTLHPDAVENGSEFLRTAVRAIIRQQDEILLLYTERYDDYSLPGGGVDDGEALDIALIREVEEETGATNIAILGSIGTFEELRPWYKKDYDNMRMLSHCFECSADRQLGPTRLEHYEQANGMRPVWVKLNDAIAHNHRVMASSDKQGMSIARETWLLEYIAAGNLDHRVA